jgi:putative phage-type endonuclease
VSTKTIVRSYQTRPEWLRERRHGIGASDAAALYGESPWQSPMSLWAEKRGLTAPTDEATVPDYIKWGLKLEPLIATAFAEDTGREVIDIPAFTIERDLAHPELLATLDRRQRTAVGVGILELKSTNFFARKQWNDGVPLYYQIQVQHQLMVTGEPYASVAVLIAGSEFYWCDIARNDAFIDDLRRRVIEFWGMVIGDIAPAPDASAATKEALARIFPDVVTPEFVPLATEALEWDEKRQKGKTMIEAGAKLVDEAEAHLKLAIGESLGAVLPNQVTYTWKQQTRKPYTVQGSTFRVLRRKGE